MSTSRRTASTSPLRPTFSFKLGFLIGRDPGSGDHLVAAAACVFKARTMKRVRPSESSSSDLLEVSGAIPRNLKGYGYFDPTSFYMQKHLHITNRQPAPSQEASPTSPRRQRGRVWSASGPEQTRRSPSGACECIAGRCFSQQRRCFGAQVTTQRRRLRRTIEDQTASRRHREIFLLCKAQRSSGGGSLQRPHAYQRIVGGDADADFIE